MALIRKRPARQKTAARQAGRGSKGGAKATLRKKADKKKPAPRRASVAKPRLSKAVRTSTSGKAKAKAAGAAREEPRGKKQEEKPQPRSPRLSLSKGDSSKTSGHGKDLLCAGAGATLVERPARPLVHLLLERRWLAGDGTASAPKAEAKRKRKSLSPAVAMQGWGVRVHAAYQDAEAAARALSDAIRQQARSARDGSMRERASLSVQSHEVFGGSSGSTCPGRVITDTSGCRKRVVYVVTSSIGESFCPGDAPPDAALHPDGCSFKFRGEAAAADARRKEEARGAPWGYPYNAGIACSKPGEVLRVFATPVGEEGANAYATGGGLKELQCYDFESLDGYNLAEAVTYSPEGLARIRMLYDGVDGTVRCLLTVSAHLIVDETPGHRQEPRATKLRRASA
eukprot:TRINITY_DN66378_c0_g1_i1.p1 TRINITY_DN66378_c0_g1~~TRINITY_DN66378_c0_g1_i1.p1  ORF type:complete len:418 (+),score=98.99 TRINITY_DN66378_c0_g1_i1:58-1254(+)